LEPNGEVRVSHPRLVVVAGLAVVAIAALAVGVPATRWRAELVARKLDGRLPDLEWRQLVRRLAPARLDAPAPAATLDEITNPFAADADIRQGAEAFRVRCSSCHRTGGPGTGVAPDLATHEFRQGDSDYDLYHTITRGVPGTAMKGQPVSAKTAWQIAAYLRTLVDAGKLGSVSPRTPPMQLSRWRLLGAGEDPAGWYTYSGSYDAHRFSKLSQIDAANVSTLRPRWILQLPTSDPTVETTPLVVDGIMFVTEPPNHVLAVDGSSGTVLWRYNRRLPSSLSACCGRVNRGLALLDSVLYLGTLDAHLVALNARTGKVVWDVEVGDYRTGYSITGAPLAVNDMIITGIAGGEYGVRGFIDAYDARSGRRRWRFYTIPAPGETGAGTWSGDSWKTGGAPTWLTGSYDRQLGLLYWGVGNPAPSFQGDARLGDNLYSNSVIALDVDSGRLRWHFQFTPHDEHDWDAVQVPVLIDATFRGAPRRLLAFANRNGFYYLLDRQSGGFILGREFARQSWARGLDSAGRPIPLPGFRPTIDGSVIYPTALGATNWWSPSYSPATGLFYVPVLESGGIFFRRSPRYAPGQWFAGSAQQRLVDEPGRTAVKALDPLTGEVRWEFGFPSRAKPASNEQLAGVGGILTTQGNVLFVGDGNLFFAIDAKTGAELWRFNAGAGILAAPVTYLVRGEQYVAVAAGRLILAFGLGSTASPTPGKSRAPARRPLRDVSADHR
jgi:alcohol dehydrogenase (cytochrome c)